jgi:hypothetical protein
VRACLVLAVAFASWGCGFHGERVSLDAGMDLAGGGGSSDLAGVDLAGADLSGGGGMLACAPPVLFISVEDLNAAHTVGGRVQPLSLSTTPPTVCAAMTGGGLLPVQPFTLTPIDGGIAVGTRDGLWVIDWNDTTRWHMPPLDPSWQPVDVIPLAGSGNGPFVALGSWQAGSSMPEIDRIDLYDATTGTLLSKWPMDWMSQPINFPIMSIARSPLDPRHLFSIDRPFDTNPNAATDVDPIAQMRYPYVGYPSGANLISIYASTQSGQRRTVWVDGTANAIYYSAETAGNAVLHGPSACNASCNLVHAVPDPTDASSFLGLCADPANSIHRSVMRWSPGGTCTLVYDGAGQGAQTRLSRLALVN